MAGCIATQRPYRPSVRKYCKYLKVVHTVFFVAQHRSCSQTGSNHGKSRLIGPGNRWRTLHAVGGSGSGFTSGHLDGSYLGSRQDKRGDDPAPLRYSGELIRSGSSAYLGGKRRPRYSSFLGYKSKVSLFFCCLACVFAVSTLVHFRFISSSSPSPSSFRLFQPPGPP